QEVTRTREELQPLMVALKDKAAALKDALADRDPEVRVSVLRALEEVGAARQQFQYSSPKGAVIPGSGDVLLDTLKASLPSVIREVKDPRETVRLRALDVLETLGPDAAAAVPALVEATRDPSLFVRWASARVLREIGPVDTARTVPALARLLS